MTFGYKAHVGADKDRGLVHTPKVNAANVHDIAVVSELLTRQEEAVMATTDILALKSVRIPLCATP